MALILSIKMVFSDKTHIEECIVDISLDTDLNMFDGLINRFINSETKFRFTGDVLKRRDIMDVVNHKCYDYVVETKEFDIIDFDVTNFELDVNPIDILNYEFDLTKQNFFVKICEYNENVHIQKFNVNLFISKSNIRYIKKIIKDLNTKNVEVKIKFCDYNRTVKYNITNHCEEYEIINNDIDNILNLNSIIECDDLRIKNKKQLKTIVYDGIRNTNKCNLLQCKKIYFDCDLNLKLCDKIDLEDKSDYIKYVDSDGCATDYLIETLEKNSVFCNGCFMI